MNILCLGRQIFNIRNNLYQMDIQLVVPLVHVEIDLPQLCLTSIICSPKTDLLATLINCAFFSPKKKIKIIVCLFLCELIVVLNLHDGKNESVGIQHLAQSL